LTSVERTVLEEAADLQRLLACSVLIEVLSEMVLRKWKLPLIIDIERAATFRL